MPNKITDFYTSKAIMQIEPKRVLDQYFDVDPDRMESTDKGTVAHYTIEDRGTASDTPLGEYAGPTGSQILSSYDIEVILKEYGEDPVIINRHWDLETNYPWFARKFEAVGSQAITVWNNLLHTIAYDTIGGATTGAASYVHPTGTFDPIADSLVYLGSDTSSEAARANVTTTDTITADWVRYAHAVLHRRGVPKIFTSRGERYLAFAHPNLMSTVKKVAGAEGGGMDIVPNSADAISLKNGLIMDWQGFYWIEDPTAVYIGLGSSSCNVFPVLYAGRDFLALPKRPVSALSAPWTANTIRFPVNEFMEIRLSPVGDTQGRLAELGFYFEAGTNIYNPQCSFRHEFYADQTIS